MELKFHLQIGIQFLEGRRQTESQDWRKRRRKGRGGKEKEGDPSKFLQFYRLNPAGNQWDCGAEPKREYLIMGLKERLSFRSRTELNCIDEQQLITPAGVLAFSPLLYLPYCISFPWLFCVQTAEHLQCHWAHSGLLQEWFTLAGQQPLFWNELTVVSRQTHAARTSFRWCRGIYLPTSGLASRDH